MKSTFIAKNALNENFYTPERHLHTSINSRQRKLLNKFMDGFEGKLTSSKWSNIAKCSKDSAVRDINDLIDKGILQKAAAGGRSTNYELIGMPAGSTI